MSLNKYDFQSIFMSYPVPDFIFELYDLDQELLKLTDGLDGLNLIFTLDETRRYEVTPVDLITIFDMGVDGVHYGLLTEFSTVEDLEQTWVVEVTPMDEPYVNIVAKNIWDFLTYETNTFIKNLYDINNLDAEDPEDKEIEEIKKIEYVCNQIQKKFNLPKIDFPESYDPYERMQVEREKMVDVIAHDELGLILPDHLKDKNQRQMHIFDPRWKDKKQIASFITEASYIEKLALCRFAQVHYSLSSDYDNDVLILLKDMLNDMGLIDESRRFML